MSRIAGLAVGVSISFVLPGAVASAELATHLFPHMDGEVGFAYQKNGKRGEDRGWGHTGNQGQRLEISGMHRKHGALAWINFRPVGVDLSMVAGASLTAHLDKLDNPGTLKVYALKAPIDEYETQVRFDDLVFDDNDVVATLAIRRLDEGKMLRIDLGDLLARGPFHGLVLESSDGLQAGFNSKDSDVQPLIELRYAFASPAQIEAALEAGRKAEAAAARADLAADDAEEAAAAAARDAATVNAAVEEARQSAAAAAGSAMAAAGSADAASNSADAASGSALTATEAAAAAVATAASLTASSEAATTAAAQAGAYATASQQAATASQTAVTTASASASAAAAAAAASAELAQQAADAAQAAAAGSSPGGSGSGSGEGSALPAGVALFSKSPEAPAGYTNTGILVNYEKPWGIGAPMPGGRYHLASAAAGGRLYVSGGYTGSAFVNTTISYEPATRAWTNLAPMPVSNNHIHTLTQWDGKLYAIGGITGGGSVLGGNFRYDPATNAWTELSPIPSPRYAHAAIAHDGKIYVIGGFNSHPGQNRVSVTQVYHVSTNSWTTAAALPTTRGYLSASLANGKIHVIGGSISGSPSAVHEIYDPATDSWSAAEPMPWARSHHGEVSADGRVYIIGGVTNVALNSVLQFDAATNSWASLNPMATGRYKAAVGLIDGKIHVSSGHGAGILSSTEVYPLPRTYYLLESVD